MKTSNPDPFTDTFRECSAAYLAVGVLMTAVLMISLASAQPLGEALLGACIGETIRRGIDRFAPDVRFFPRVTILLSCVVFTMFLATETSEFLVLRIPFVSFLTALALWPGETPGQRRARQDLQNRLRVRLPKLRPAGSSLSDR